MFTGIIEQIGVVRAIENDQTNIHFTIESSFTNELKIDQSVAHNGVCLTVVNIDGPQYTVTAIQETLNKTNLSDLKVGDKVNLERCMVINGRIDGHIVQGHVDQTAVTKSILNEEGSWVFTFEYDSSLGNITVEKGSICVNGISLTVVNSGINTFSVAIIPYTYEHTNLHNLVVGSRVNLEFDIIGKYVSKYMTITR